MGGKNPLDIWCENEAILCVMVYLFLVSDICVFVV